MGSAGVRHQVLAAPAPIYYRSTFCHPLLFESYSNAYEYSFSKQVEVEVEVNDLSHCTSTRTYKYMCWAHASSYDPPGSLSPFMNAKKLLHDRGLSAQRVVLGRGDCGICMFHGFSTVPRIASLHPLTCRTGPHTVRYVCASAGVSQSNMR